MINAVGPFAPHPQLSYAAFLADFRAGKVGHISHWRDRLEVTETEALYVVVVPPDRDLSLDLTADTQRRLWTSPIRGSPTTG